MFVLWDTKRLANPVDALFLRIWKAFKCLLQNTVLSCLLDLKLCKKNSFLMMWFSNGQALDDLIQFVKVLTSFWMLLQVKFYHYHSIIFLTRKDVGRRLKPFLFKPNCFQQEAVSYGYFCCWNNVATFWIFPEWYRIKPFMGTGA